MVTRALTHRHYLDHAYQTWNFDTEKIPFRLHCDKIPKEPIGMNCAETV